MKHLRLYENYDYEELKFSALNALSNDIIKIEHISDIKKPVIDSYKKCIRNIWI